MANNPISPSWFNLNDGRYQLERDPRLWYAAMSNREILKVVYLNAVADNPERLWGNFPNTNSQEEKLWAKFSYITSPEEFWNNYLFATSIEAITSSDSETNTHPPTAQFSERL